MKPAATLWGRALERRLLAEYTQALGVAHLVDGHVPSAVVFADGENYGWMKREGYFENGGVRGGELKQLYPLPPEIPDGRVKDGFTYPVAVYDHDEGHSVADGFAYHGRIPALTDKFVFGDIQNGRVFVSDLAAMKKADDGIPRTGAPIEKTTDRSVARADLRISRGRDGELFLTSRQDGMIRVLVPDAGGAK